MLISFQFRFQYVQVVGVTVKSYLKIVVNAAVKDAYALRRLWKLKFLPGLVQAVF
jgi:hypothetical protein